MTDEQRPIAPSAPIASAAPLLVIEDDAMVRAALARILSPPHAVMMAAGGRAALALFDQGHRFPLILCDLTMPDVDGVALYRRLGERWPDQARRVVFMTGGVCDEGVERFLRSAPLGHVEKPFDLTALLGRVAELLERLGPPAP